MIDQLWKIFHKEFTTEYYFWRKTGSFLVIHKIFIHFDDMNTKFTCRKISDYAVKSELRNSML